MIASIPSRLAIAAIVAYQRHLSPRKGFRCAHRARHGGDSCSEHARKRISAGGLIAGIAAMRERFRACREATSWFAARRKSGATSGAASEADTVGVSRHDSTCLSPEFCECCVPTNEILGQCAPSGCEAGCL